MSSTTSIHAATTEDIDALLPMVEQYWRFENIEGFDPARMRSLLTRVIEDASLGRAWVARVYGEPAAYLLAVYVFSLEHQGVTAEIDELFVIPQHRGLGIGARCWRPPRRSSSRRLHECVVAARAQQPGGAQFLPSTWL